MGSIRYFEKGANDWELRVEQVSEVVQDKRDLAKDNIFAKAILPSHAGLLERFEQINYEISELMPAKAKKSTLH